MKQLNNVQVNIHALFEILGKNLYSTPNVVVRELIQNAVDSITRREIELQDSFEPLIRVSCQPSEKKIVIEDNGAGMTREEILSFLATVGSGYTRNLRERSGESSLGHHLIGYFGLGFLTAYSVSRKVRVLTTSYQNPGKRHLFTSSGGETYAVEEVESNGKIGTKVILSLKPEYDYLSEPDTLQEMIQKYCGLLSVPIELKDRGRVNLERPPWEESPDSVPPVQKKREHLEFARRFETMFDVIGVIPMRFSGGDSEGGLLWIQDSGVYGTSDMRNISVYLRGMLVQDDFRDFLPYWAGFIGGVIHSEKLTPTASREDLIKDETYYDIKEEIRNKLIEGLAEIAAKDHPTWRRILRRHNEAILGACVAEDSLFEALYREVKLPTSEGELIIGEILKNTGHTLYVSLNEHPGFEEVLFRALKQPVISGWRYGSLSFARKYADIFHANVVLLGTREGNLQLFREVSLSDGERDILVEGFVGSNEKLIIAEYEPEYIPLVVMRDEDYFLKKRLESDEADERISSGALALARLYTRGLEAGAERFVIVNTASPLVQYILTAEPDRRQKAASMVRSLANMLSSPEGENEGSLGDDLQRVYHTILELMKG